MKKTRIIILKNKNSITKKLQIKLNKLKYNNIKVVSRVKQIISFNKKNQNDVLFVDLKKSPKKYFFKEIKNLLKIRDIPVVYIYHKRDDKIYNNMKETNPVGYLYPPYKKKDLKSIITLALTRYMTIF